MTLVLGLLGPVVVWGGDGPRPVAARLDRAVLTHLALAEGRSLSVDLLIDAVWGAHPPAGARNSLQVKVSRLRGSLRATGVGIEHRQGAYALPLGPEQVDSRVFSAEVGADHRGGAPDEEEARLRSALARWRGSPLTDVGDHPRVVAARLRLLEERTGAKVRLAGLVLTRARRDGEGQSVVEALGLLRRVLEEEPQRTDARLLLMRGLEQVGRRAEALAVFDAGRRALADDAGLLPPLELQDEFERLLAAERRASRRPATTVPRRAGPPAGALETARWLAAEGESAAAVRLALRGAWWWWFGGRHTEGLDLFAELLDPPRGSGEAVPDDLLLPARAWTGVLGATGADAARQLGAAERVLISERPGQWTRADAVAAVLVAERFTQRGEHARATPLTERARRHFSVTDDDWGLALVAVVAAKAALLRGHVAAASAGALAAVREFGELGDPAGEVLALDVAGYAAEVAGDLALAQRLHHRALGLARRVDAAPWQATQLTRLGSLAALTGGVDAGKLLDAARAAASGARSRTGTALVDNAQGLALTIAGRLDEAAAIHTRCLDWYERQGSAAGVSYTAGRLASVRAERDPDDAGALAERSVRLAVRTSDPRAVAHALEAVATVETDPRRGARALGAARALRRRTRAPLPEVLAEPLRQRERVFGERLQDRLLAELREGAREAGRLVPGATS